MPWQGPFVNANGDPSVDLRSNLAADRGRKMVYEYLKQFTDDPGVQDTLTFLMTREVTHYQQFTAALNELPVNFPPGQLAGDERFQNVAFNMSNGDELGAWTLEPGAGAVAERHEVEVRRGPDIRVAGHPGAEEPGAATQPGGALSRYLKYVVAQLIVELWRWISVGALVFQAAASSAVTARQTAKRSSISVRHWVALQPMPSWSKVRGDAR